MYLRQAILDTGYWTTEIQPIALLSRLKTLLDLVESPLFGRVSESLRKYWIQERNYSGRSVHQLKVERPSDLAYYLGLTSETWSQIRPSLLFFTLIHLAYHRDLVHCGPIFVKSFPKHLAEENKEKRNLSSPRSLLSSSPTNLGSSRHNWRWTFSLGHLDQLVLLLLFMNLWALRSRSKSIAAASRS